MKRAKRNIPFGYEIRHGEICVVPASAKIVRDTYIDYLDGKSFEAIALDLTVKQVDYFEGKTEWDKHMVKRLLEGEFYCGNEKYPQIIEREQFDTVARLIATKYKGCNKDPVVSILRKRSFCTECGERLYHNTKTKGREAWKCKRCDLVSIPDDDFYQGIKSIQNQVIEHPELLDEIEQSDTYESEFDITVKSNELNALLNSPKVDFETAYSDILILAAMKYENCENDISKELTETIKQDYIHREKLHEIDIDLIERTVSHITAVSHNKIAVHFINGAVIRSERS